MAKVISPIPLSSDPTVYTPPKLIARERQLSELLHVYNQIKNGNRPITVIISGPKSMGKTVTILHFIKTVKVRDSSIGTVYLRCKNTFRETIKQAISNIPKEQCSAIDKFVSQQKLPLLLILDEIHNIKPQNLNLPLKHIYDSYEGQVNPILITNKPFREVRQWFTEEVISRMNWSLAKFINFNPYSLQEIYQILLQRCQEALEPNSWEEQAILKCAKYGSQTKDLRNAINLLREACFYSDEPILKATHVDACLKKAGLISLAEDLNNEPFHIRLYLTAITIEQLNRLQVPVHVADERYRKLARMLEEDEIKFPYRLRKRLEEIGIITIETKRYQLVDSKGKRTRGSSSFITLNDNPIDMLRALSLCQWDDTLHGEEIKQKLNRILEQLNK